MKNMEIRLYGPAATPGVTEKVREIIAAVGNLGYNPEFLSISKISYGRFTVIAEDVSLGIYDTNRHTFVD